MKPRFYVLDLSNSKVSNITYYILHRGLRLETLGLIFALSIDLVIEANQESNLAKIHINTISSFSGFGGGTYKMTSVKELTGTKDFLGMQGKSCAMESYQDCVDRNIQQACKCSLWEHDPGQVIVNFHFLSNLAVTFRKGRCAAHWEETALTPSLTKVLIARCPVSDSTPMLG